MDRDALVAECERRFRDESNDVYLATDWVEYLKTAALEVNQASPLWPWLESETSSFTVTTTGEASLPTDALAVIAVYDITNESDLPQLHGVRHRQVYFTTDTGEPECYRVKGSTLQLFPKPESTVTLRVQYQSGGDLLTAGNVEPPWPEAFHRILVDGALRHAHEDDDNGSAADRAFARFQDGIGRLVNAVLTNKGGGEYTALQDDYWLPRF